MTIPFFPAIAGERGCGTRVAGGTYIEVGLVPPGAALRGMGRPVEDFLLDPPVKLHPAMDFSDRGVNIIEQPATDGRVIHHVVDVVGERYYPNVADFVEEVRHMGLSRRIQSTVPFGLLTQHSRIILVHRKAWVNHWPELRNPTGNNQDIGYRCPRELTTPDALHRRGEAMCAGVWWEDLDPDTVRPSPTLGLVERDMPSFSYTGKPRPDSVDTDYESAFFASFPISRLVVVKGEKSDLKLERARAARLRVDEVDE